MAPNNPPPLNLPPLPSELNSAILKVKRAVDHIRDLYDVLQAFHDANPYAISVKQHSQPGYLICEVDRVDPVPDRIVDLLGDAIHCLRTALDHAAFALDMRRSGHPQEMRQIMFPISWSAQGYKSESPRKIKGMSQQAIDAIGKLEPYKGGKGHQLWVLNELDVIDKHRSIIAVGAICNSIRFGDDAEAEFRPQFESIGIKGEEFEALMSEVGEMTVTAFGPSKIVPLEAGDILYGPVPAEKHKELEFSFGVAICEPGVVEGKSIVETIHHLCDFVCHILVTLAPLF
jgi:hypothetical protein